MGLREQKRERQRQAIIDAAIEMFATSGYDATSVRDIAERLQISQATFFNYFPTKQSVVDAAVDQHLGRIVEIMDVLDDDAPVLEQFADLMGKTAAIVMTDPQFATLLKLDVRFTLASGNLYKSYVRLARLLEAGQRRGEVRPNISPGHLAEILITSVLGTLSERVLPVNNGGSRLEAGTDLQQRLQETWSVLWFGISGGAPAGAVSLPSVRANGRVRKPSRQ